MEQRIKALEGEVTRLNEAINRMELLLARREHIDSLVTDLQHAVKGNGKEGLEKKVAVVTERLDKEMALVQEREEKRSRNEWFIYTLLVSNLAGVVFGFFIK